MSNNYPRKAGTKASRPPWQGVPDEINLNAYRDQWDKIKLVVNDSPQMSEGERWQEILYDLILFDILGRTKAPRGKTLQV